VAWVTSTTTATAGSIVAALEELAKDRDRDVRDAARAALDTPQT
jgi:uncharacterized membrane protein